MFCKECGNELKNEGAKFCANCGTKIEWEPKKVDGENGFCLFCGDALAEGIKFCVKCGANIEKINEIVEAGKEAHEGGFCENCGTGLPNLDLESNKSVLGSAVSTSVFAILGLALSRSNAFRGSGLAFCPKCGAKFASQVKIEDSDEEEE